MRCAKPRFPDSYRDETGAYGVEVSANGHCFHTTSAFFVTFNAKVDRTLLLGAPATASVAVRITGVGFPVPGLDGAVCEFSYQKLRYHPTRTTNARHTYRIYYCRC